MHMGTVSTHRVKEPQRWTAVPPKHHTKRVGTRKVDSSLGDCIVRAEWYNWSGARGEGGGVVKATMGRGRRGLPQPSPASANLVEGFRGG